MCNSEKTPHIQWHDLRMAPYDLPEQYEQVLTTSESVLEIRRVHTDVYFHYTDQDEYHYGWFLKMRNPNNGLVEEETFWEEIVAWAYLPEPYAIVRETL